MQDDVEEGVWSQEERILRGGSEYSPDGTFTEQRRNKNKIYRLNKESPLGTMPGFYEVSKS